jgi:hypothetical protein
MERFETKTQIQGDSQSSNKNTKSLSIDCGKESVGNQEEGTK